MDGQGGETLTVEGAAVGAAIAAEVELLASRRYQVGEEIARGGNGRILRGRDLALDREIALKEPLAMSAIPRLRAEAHILARLQHPSIVPVYDTGVREDGRPFFAMKLVDGKSLRERIAEAPLLEARLALVPHVVAIAEAVAYAHAQGIIHRDLKPANVLVGKYGETIVIDWGLATALGTPAGGAPQALPAGLVDTVSGTVMGTPAYMAPEQARGEAADARTDVYAIGAILYHVLAGAPPYAGRGDVQIGTRAEAPTALAELQPRAPADLVAVVDKAMAPGPADRYPTAASVAEDLVRFQTGRLVEARRYTRGERLTRWIGRHRAAVTVAAIAAIALATGGAISVRRVLREERLAHAQRELAEQHRADAEELLEFMLNDLKQRLEPVNQLEVLEEVAQKAAAYYARHPQPRDADQRRRRAQVVRNLGEVAQARGDTAAALEAYRGSLATLEELAARDPDEPRLRFEVAVGHGRIGEALRAQGDASGALAEYRAAVAIWERLVDDDPGRALFRQSLATRLDEVADVLLWDQGDVPGALGVLRRSLELRLALVGEADDDADAQRDLSVSHQRIGDALLRLGDTEGALASARADLAIGETLAARDPASATLQNDLSISLERLGSLLALRGDIAGATSAYRTSLALVAKLAADDPANTAWQRGLGIAHSKIGNLLLDTRTDLAGALEEFRASQAIVESMVARDPGNATWQQDLFASRVHVGSALLALGDGTAALAEYRASLVIADALAAQDPTNAVAQHDRVGSHLGLADAWLASGKPAEAVRSYREAVAIARELVARDPANLVWQHDLATILAGTGAALSDPGASTAAYREAIAILETLVATDPSNAAWQHGLADLRLRIAQTPAAK